MNGTATYRILGKGFSAVLGLALMAGGASAQISPKAPTQIDIYCSGVALNKPLPNDAYVISGEDSIYRVTYNAGDLVYINRGSNQGVKVGDEFDVTRPISNPQPVQWFAWQNQLIRAMGQMYADIGRIHVLSVQPKVSTARVTFSCEQMYRGDLIQPFVPRPSPPYPIVAFDAFAPPSGKKTAMVVTTKGYGEGAAQGYTVYVNLGSAQGVQIGDYIRVFRYQGESAEAPYQTRGNAYKMYGFGSTPVAYQWNDLPRQIIGEGVVIRVGENSASVYLSYSQSAVFPGDYIEIQ